uniref:(northern house mosquito) hypothetical protein n=1 Tax=Culex pipiens TaxID=7175 RepID=A0A8D8HQC3_CULPI
MQNLLAGRGKIHGFSTRTVICSAPVELINRCFSSRNVQKWPAPGRGGSALAERPRGQGFSSADLEFDKDVLCAFPRLHLAGAFHLTDFHLFGFLPFTDKDTDST